MDQQPPPPPAKPSSSLGEPDPISRASSPAREPRRVIPSSYYSTGIREKDGIEESEENVQVSRAVSYREPTARSATLGHGDYTTPPRPMSQGGTRHLSATIPNIARRSTIDFIVPVEHVEEKPPEPAAVTVGERLAPTLEHAQRERDKYARKAKMTGYSLNLAIGLSAVIGALITGLSAVTTGRQTSIMTSILGGMSTIVASFLARARGSAEPELSISRTKDLESFIRECEIFKLDKGHKMGDEHDEHLTGFRTKFEELLGNASGERKLSPTGVTANNPQNKV